MAYKLIQADAFGRDLDAVISYLVFSLENKGAAANLLRAIERCYDDLERMPLMYAVCNDPYLKELGYHKAVIRNYILIYKVDEDTQTVQIMRLFHGRQDYEKLI